MSDSLIMHYKADIIDQYREQKKMADAAIARCSDPTFFASISKESDNHTNSIAVLVKHIGGNLRSRWSDFLTTDGEKPDRNRESEFNEQHDTRQSLLERWELGWSILFNSLESLQEEDFAKTVIIRAEELSVIHAIHRNLLHATHHIGQIELLATALK